MTIVKLYGEDLGEEVVRVRCNLTEASAPVEVDYDNGEGWLPTQYQCADCRHDTAGLIEIGSRLAAAACEVPFEHFDCEWASVKIVRLLRIYADGVYAGEGTVGDDGEFVCGAELNEDPDINTEIYEELEESAANGEWRTTVHGVDYSWTIDEDETILEQSEDPPTESDLLDEIYAHLRHTGQYEIDDDGITLKEGKASIVIQYKDKEGA